MLERSGVNRDTLLNVRKWIKEGVEETEFFFTHIKGNVRGKLYDSEWPESVIFPNSPACR